MKTIDKDGLLISSFQGNVFASSIDKLECSSEVFMRRFMLSNIAVEFDLLAVLDEPLTINEVYSRIEDEFGKSTYGSIKYEKEVLFWIGYIYRYFAYTYDLPSKNIYKLVKPKELNELYYTYHTFDPKVAIENILEEKNISFDLETQNKKLLNMLRMQKYEKNLVMEEMTTNYAYSFYKNFKGNHSLFYKKETSKDCAYSIEEFDRYIKSKKVEGYLLKAIIYNEEVIGEIGFKPIKDSQYQLDILFKDDNYENKSIGIVAISKAIDLAREMDISSLIVEILKTDERKNQAFKELGFEYYKEDDKFVCYVKNIINNKR